MGQQIDIREGELKNHVKQALEWIRSGFIIVAPLENSYVFLVDAFLHDGVRAMHVLRGDDLGVAAQVLVSGEKVLEGIVREIPDSARTMIKEFWPGQLSLLLPPHVGLNWDLGDDKALDEICVRTPSAEFVLALLKKSGPLAVASAALAGRPPILDVNLIAALDSDLAGIFHTGKLKTRKPSTLVRAAEGKLTVVREGAISFKALAAKVPEIEREAIG
ncbi:MAG: Sua5/YciO/YrdC/YwlC family protein [Actinobacteria bacterium]|nr:Sua5/YciO/YrdC/YwlC family protein [Actinomycetota bacterium]